MHKAKNRGPSNPCCEGKQWGSCAARPGDPACDEWAPELEEGCRESIELHLAGRRNRWGFVENATLGLAGHNCTYCEGQNGCESCADFRKRFKTTKEGLTIGQGVTVIHLWTLEEAAKMCDAGATDFGNTTIEYGGVIVNTERVRGGTTDGMLECFFIWNIVGPIDYRKAATGEKVMARLRKSSEHANPLPNCMKVCGKTAHGERWTGKYEFCTEIAQKFCSKEENTNSPWCKQFYSSKTGNADGVLTSHCAKVLARAGSINKVTAQEAHLCACFWPKAVYDDYFNRDVWKNIPPSVTQPPCVFPGCAGNSENLIPYAYKTGAIVCPDVKQCLQSCTITSAGKLVGAGCEQAINCFNEKAKGKSRGIEKNKNRGLVVASFNWQSMLFLIGGVLLLLLLFRRFRHR